MGESGHRIHPREEQSTRKPDCRYLFQKEESKRRVSTSIFEKGRKKPFSP
jgi:hypothetical protein